MFEYEAGMTHVKAPLVDELLAVIGTTNFDNRSFRRNDEINLTIADSAVARRMEELFRKDLARSRPYSYQDYLGRSVKDRLFEWAVLPFRSEL